MGARPRALLTAFGDLAQQVYPDQVRAELETFTELRDNDLNRRFTEAELMERIAEVDACLTTWGAPQFTAEVLAAAPRLKIIAHAAGTVKPFISPIAFARGVIVTNAAGVIARYVGEMALLLSLACLRDLPRYHRALKEENAWRVPEAGPSDTLRGKRVGLIGFGATGREFAKLLPPFGVELLCCDPVVTPAVMAEHGARPAALEEVLRTCDVISLHAASLPSTRNLLNAERLAMIRDGAVLVNTARGALIEMEALVKELGKGRFRAALDVFDPEEPLPPDHPLRGLPNVILTPHVSGPVPTRYWEMGRQAVENVRTVLSGGVPAGAITAAQFETMA
jgi:phosphoglycerate dehydrogenase-like enzyme